MEFGQKYLEPYLLHAISVDSTGSYIFSSILTVRSVVGSPWPFARAIEPKASTGAATVQEIK